MQLKNRKLTGEQMNLAFRYTIPPSSDELKTNPHERLALRKLSLFLAVRNPGSRSYKVTISRDPAS